MTHSSVLWTTLASLLGALACSGNADGAVSGDEGAGDATSTLAQDLRGPDASEYVTLRRDLRRCAFPFCGGFFVDSVNRATLRCADGRRSAECYVAELELSALGLSPEQEAELLGSAESFLLSGRLSTKVSSAGRWGQLLVSEAWQGHPGVTPSGRFFRARNEGIVCITSPCLSFSAELLNRDQPSFQVAEIDLSAVSDDPSAAFEQLSAADGLLLAGQRSVVRGPAGRALGLEASEFYLPFVAQTQACGGLRPSQCAEGSFCNFPPESICGAADGPGVCEPIPEVCTRIFAPVCGCDGQTYANACEAAASSVSVISEGECAPPEPQLCGSRGLPACDADSFCSFPPESDCGRADRPGVCARRPEACIQLFRPVCGCDGQTYGNSCNAASAGVSVEFEGACEDQP
ncbi:MAG TPA: DUF6748 domain-containing protein [Polyangiaceae bacterium]|nr:DUF6748 domain-containing protein [Polyangiaceae bacterium]